MSDTSANDHPQSQGSNVVDFIQRVITILIGLALIVVITPLSQFLTMNTVSADIEVGAPVGWAVGIMFSIVLLAFPVRLLAKSKRLSRPNMVLLYAMLTVAVPVMNLGLVRQVYMSMYALTSEYIYNGTDTYRTAFNSQDEDWFPKVPTREGLAWAEAEQLVGLLDDTRRREASSVAERMIDNRLASEAKRLKNAETGETVTIEADATLIPAINRLNSDASRELLSSINEDKTGHRKTAAEKLGIIAPLELQDQVNRQASELALERLSKPDALAGFSPLVVLGLPEKSLRFSDDEQVKIEKVLSTFNESQNTEYQQKIASLQAMTDRPDRAAQVPLWIVFRDDVSLLSSDHRETLIKNLSDNYMVSISALNESDFDQRRNNFVLMQSRLDRQALLRMGMDTTSQAPNMQMRTFVEGSREIEEVDEEDASGSVVNNTAELLGDMNQAAKERVPWNVWAIPMIMWIVLSVVIFMFLMIVAEYLRRKWVERENLAFPQVEIVDHFIRHDAKLESADDPLLPNARLFPFVNLVFIGGLITGLCFILYDGLMHYNFVEGEFALTFDISGNVLQEGVFKQMNKIFFVLSPIILGIAFLISLELSFSIFSLFFLFQISMLVLNLSAGPIKDPAYAGWAGGKSHPFPMEQMLGAVTMFTMLLLFKSLRSGAGDKAVIDRNGTFVPRWLFWAGLVVLPLILVALFYSMGFSMTAMVFLILACGLFLAQSIAAARARAESGLPTHHVSYEFTKLPLMFGLTGFLGAANFTRYLFVAFVPISLLGRTLSSHLENMELARRNKLRYGTLAIASLLSFITAVTVGMFAFLLLTYMFGDLIYGHDLKMQGTPSENIGKYSLWVSHFLGEDGLDSWGGARWIRIYFIVGGALFFLALHLLRGRFLSFPLHPLGYLIILISVYYSWISPYYKEAIPGKAHEATTLWGSVLVAWVIKKLIIKYGGMNAYKQAKPFFIGLVVGAIVMVFFWNMIDLYYSLQLFGVKSSSQFIETIPYSPSLY